MISMPRRVFTRKARSSRSAARDHGREFRYIRPGALWQAFRGGPRGPVVLLIDEIDKAPRDFPNDLLRELEEYRFMIEEAPPEDRIIECPPEKIPIIIITSNSERRLPEPFLQRCIYHNIEMDDDLIARVTRTRAKNVSIEGTALRAPFLDKALTIISHIRATPLLDKLPTVMSFGFGWRC
jgi:MoxR-like ATPase